MKEIHYSGALLVGCLIVCSCSKEQKLSENKEDALRNVVEGEMIELCKVTQYQ